jgi:hypothetical protein
MSKVREDPRRVSDEEVDFLQTLLETSIFAMGGKHGARAKLTNVSLLLQCIVGVT